MRARSGQTLGEWTASTSAQGTARWRAVAIGFHVTINNHACSTTWPGAAPLMPTQPNRNIQRLTLHVGVGTLASALSNVFSAVFLIRVGLAPAEVFLAFAAIL